MPVPIQKGEPDPGLLHGWDADDIQYVEHSNHRFEGVDDAAEGFYKHREFLILTMLSGKERVNWPISPIYRHMRQRFPVSMHKHMFWDLDLSDPYTGRLCTR